MKWKKSEWAVAAALVLVGIVAIGALIGILLEYVGGNSVYRELESYVILPDEQTEEPSQGTRPNPEPDLGGQERAAADGKTETEPSGDQRVYYGRSPQVDFISLQAQNSDVVGWIYGPGSAINYPVVQGEDNSYYLTYMFNGKENKCGSIFMDCLNGADMSSTNSILHGHHMRDGSMFACLTRYDSQAYYDTHPVFWFVTPEKSYYVELFTGFVTDLDSDVWQVEFATGEEYQSWLGRMKENSAFESGVKPGAEDRILTLATCSYKYDDARFVVMGILREENNF